MEPVILFLAAFVSLVLLFAQVKMFSVDSTLKEILEELRRTRRAIEERSDAMAPRVAPGELRNEVAVARQQVPVASSSPGDASQTPAKGQAVLAPWQRDHG